MNTFNLTGYIRHIETRDFANKAKSTILVGISRKENKDGKDINVSASQAVEYWHEKGVELPFKKNDFKSVSGFFKPEEWTDKNSGEKKSKVVFLATDITDVEKKAN